MRKLVAKKKQSIVATLRALNEVRSDSTLPRPSPLLHFHAARLPAAGDLVMAVSRHIDPTGLFPTRLEIRAFSAAAAGRGELPGLSGSELLAHDGGLAYVELKLGRVHSADADERMAQLRSFQLRGADSAERGTHVQDGLADWLCSVLEAELLYAGGLGLRGTRAAFLVDQPGESSSFVGDFDAWAKGWLQHRKYTILEDGKSFAKIVNGPLLQQLEGDHE